MKDTFNTIKSSLQLRAKELNTIAILSVISFIFGHIILRIVMEFDDSSDLTSFELGTIMTAMIIFFATVTIGSNHYANHINYAISMGKCRRGIITAHIVVALAKSLIATSLLYIFHGIESYICSTTYKHIPVDFDFNKIFTFEGFFVILIFLTALETFTGAMMARFGQKTFWILWIISVISFTSIPSYIEQTIEGTANAITATIGQFFIDIFTNASLNMLLLGACSIFIILALLPYVLLRKHRVTL